MAERYATIARTLLQEIEQGRYSGGHFPRRVELAARFGVTRSTVDRGVAILERKGLLVSQQGSGTYVAHERVPPAFVMVGRPAATLDLGSGGCRVDVVPEESVEGRAKRAVLRKYDGVLWFLPTSRALSWAAELEGTIPQVVINRHTPALNHVSTAHRDAIRGITARRLAAAVEAVPHFLREPRELDTPVSDMREQGFVDACREARRFYEVAEMPAAFERKLEALEELLGQAAGRPLLLVSAGREQTGAVMAWARQRCLRWRRDVWYSDFDNDEDVLTWGVRVTSFLQDYQRLVDLAAERLVALLQGSERSVKIVIPPIPVDGDT